MEVASFQMCFGFQSFYKFKKKNLYRSKSTQKVNLFKCIWRQELINHRVQIWHSACPDMENSQSQSFATGLKMKKKVKKRPLKKESEYKTYESRKRRV